MKIAIYSRFLKKEHISFVQILFDILAQRDAQLFIFEEYYQSFDDRVKIQQKLELFKEHEDFKAQNIDFMISLGGDGTILDVVTIVRDTGVPIMGINLGRLGFLAMIEKNRIEQALDALYSDSYTLDQRSILYLESSPSIFGDKNFALNDFTILKRDTSSMVIIHTYVNGEFLNSYWADGIIVATPTGSIRPSVAGRCWTRVQVRKIIAQPMIGTLLQQQMYSAQQHVCWRLAWPPVSQDRHRVRQIRSKSG